TETAEIGESGCGSRVASQSTTILSLCLIEAPSSLQQAAAMQKWLNRALIKRGQTLPHFEGTVDSRSISAIELSKKTQCLGMIRLSLQNRLQQQFDLGIAPRLQ